MANDIIRDQPSPLPSSGEPVWPLVQADVAELFPADDLTLLLVRDMGERDRVGRERYGMPLAADNGRDHLVDACQEILDCAVYLKCACLSEQGDAAVRACFFYETILHLTRRLRLAILKREQERQS